MTAKEIAKDCYEEWEIGDSQRVHKCYEFSPEEFKNFVDTIRKEQRENCLTDVKEYFDKTIVITKSAIFSNIETAKQPDTDI